MTRRVRSSIMAVVIVVAGAVGAPVAGSPAPPALPRDGIESVEIAIGGLDGGPTRLRVTSADAQAIAALLGVLGAGEPVADHKCHDTGEIVLRRQGGGMIRLGLLGGHDEGYWQIRFYDGAVTSLFRLEQVELARALEPFGVAASAPARLLR